MFAKFTALIASTSLLITAIAHADGIPEPGLVMYGAIRNAGNNARLTTGTLTWTITPAAGGSSVVVSTPLSDIAGQYSYILRVPFETLAGSATAATNTLRLNSTTTAYNRPSATVAYNGTNYSATIQAPALTAFNFSTAARGSFELVDLSVNIPGFNPGSQYSPNVDSDGDGMSDYAEFIAGTDMYDANSVFRFTSIKQLSPGMTELKWSSATNKVYTVLRASQLSANAINFVVIQSNILSAPPQNTFIDSNASAITLNFYRLSVQ